MSGLNNEKGLRGQAVRGSVVSLISRSVSYAIQLTGTAVLARMVLPDQFGLVAMVTSLADFFWVFRDLGLTDATIQQKDISPAQLSTLFVINVIACIGLGAVLAALSPVIAWFYHEPRLTGICLVTALSYGAAGLSVQHIAVMKREMLFTRVAVMDVVANLGATLTTVLLALLGWGYWAIAVKPLALAVWQALSAWVACRWKPGRPAPFREVRSLVLFGGNTLAFYSINYFSRNLDKTLIGRRYGATELGYYQKAYQLFVLPINQLSIPLQHVAVVTLSKLRSDEVSFRRFYLKAVKLMAFMGFPVSAFMWAFSLDLVLVILGSAWTMAAELFAILGIGAGVQMIYGTQSWLHVSLGRADRRMRWGMVTAVATVGSFFIGLLGGTRGVAIAQTVVAYALLIPGLVYAGRPVQLSAGSLLSAMWRSFVASGLAAGGVRFVMSRFITVPAGIVTLCVSAPLFLAMYLALFVVVHGGTGQLREHLRVLAELRTSRRAR